MPDCFIVHKDLPQTDLHPNKFTIVSSESGSVALSADLDENHLVQVDATAGVITITLPSAVGINGVTYNIKKIDSSHNKVTIDGNGTQTIDDSLTQELKKQYEAITIISNNSNWNII